MQELYKTFLQGEPNSAEAHHLLHTHYTDRTSEVLPASLTTSITAPLPHLVPPGPQVKSRSDEAFGRVPPALELKPADHPHH